MKVFGIGMSKTGTRSLHKALSILGYRTVHWPNDPITVSQIERGDFRLKVVENNDAVTDNPIFTLYPILDLLYPGSKFILTTRSLDSWLRSAEAHFGRTVDRNDNRYVYRLISYNTLTFNRDWFAFLFKRHHRQVEEYFADRKADLLVLPLEEGNFWKKLCDFLGKGVPDVPYPHSHKTEFLPES